MKRKMIIGAVLGVVALLAFALFNGSRLRKIEIENSIEIDAPRDRVFQMISQLGNYPKWSPFLAQDPSQKYSLQGADGTVGVRYIWEGSNGNDAGYQELTLLEPGRRVEFKCNIHKAFTAQPTFQYTISQEEKMVRVDQKFQLESGLVDAVFLWIFSVKPEMQKTNQKGLVLLKHACENKY